jgi:hypothetical protein
MIEINLLPEELRKKESRFPHLNLSQFNVQDIPILKIVAIGGVALLAVQAVVIILGLIVKFNSGLLDKHYEALLPNKREIQTLKADCETMSKKVQAIDDLMVRRFGWARKLSDLSDAITPEVWLTAISYNERIVERQNKAASKVFRDDFGKEVTKVVMEKIAARDLVLEGYAISTREEGAAMVGKLVKNLERNARFYSDFVDISVGAIKAVKFDGQDVVSFKLTCRFRDTK